VDNETNNKNTYYRTRRGGYQIVNDNQQVYDDRLTFSDTSITETMLTEMNKVSSDDQVSLWTMRTTTRTNTLFIDDEDERGNDTKDGDGNNTDNDDEMMTTPTMKRTAT